MTILIFLNEVHSGSAAVGKILIEDFLKNTVIMGKY
jgi:hypothetical protein